MWLNSGVLLHRVLDDDVVVLFYVEFQTHLLFNTFRYAIIKRYHIWQSNLISNLNLQSQ